GWTVRAGAAGLDGLPEPPSERLRGPPLHDLQGAPAHRRTVGARRRHQCEAFGQPPHVFRVETEAILSVTDEVVGAPRPRRDDDGEARGHGLVHDEPPLIYRGRVDEGPGEGVVRRERVDLLEAAERHPLDALLPYDMLQLRAEHAVAEHEQPPRACP